MLLDFRAKGVRGEIKQERGMLYSGKPCQTDSGVDPGFDQQFELLMTESLKAWTKLPFHSLGASSRPALQLIFRKDALFGLVPRSCF